MKSSEFHRQRIEDELHAAQEARDAGNEGKARVCARRAAGAALSWYFEVTENRSWGGDALTLLKQAAANKNLPAEVRDAAIRLTTQISDRSLKPFSEEPVADARIIVTYILSQLDGHGD